MEKITAVLNPANRVTAALVTSAPAQIVFKVGQGPSGPAGNFESQLSADPSQKATTGTDGKLLVPDSPIDPLAYYTLAKA